MVTTKLIRYLLPFFFACSLFAQTKGKLETISLFEKEVFLRGEDRRGPYFLPDSLIIQGSEKVFIDNNLLQSDEYEMDYINGEIRFPVSVPAGAEIRLSYKKSPYIFQKEYYHHKLIRRVFGAPTESVDMRFKPKNEEEDIAAQLTKSGSITRGVTVGSNRGLKVNSSLNINVSGKVAENVEVVAALTDQSTPIQPEGTTQNLQEIDKVFVQIKAPNVSATMGDFNLEYSSTQFAGYSRKLQGAMGKVEYDHYNVTVSGAVSRGKYYSMSFLGTEGNQGPYQLQGDRGQIDIIVLAGTERVFIDGEAMVRGETNDYVIDYASGQITFSRRRLITSDSRIVVDFQYSDEKFKRNLYSANANTSLWDGKFKFGTTLLRESDDKENPLDFTLTDEKREVLAQAGDESNNAVLNGATYVGKGNGRYILNTDSAFVYVGPDSGDYTVVFSDVGEGKGDYLYKGGGIYEYAGKDVGRYAPVVLLPTAKSHSVLDFDMALSPVSFFSINSEIAVSSLDNNLYSKIDDNDNQGYAQNWTVSLKPNSLRFLGKNWGALNVKGNYRKIDDQFNDIDRTNEVEYNRKWDIGSNQSREEIVKETSVLYEPIKDLAFGGELGAIDKGSYFSSNRWSASSRLARKNIPSFSYKVEDINKNDKNNQQTSDWLRQKGQAEYSFWKIKPSVAFEGEIKKENWSDSVYTGFRFENFTGGLEARPFSKLTASAKFSQRQDSDYLGNNLFEKVSTATTQNYQLQLQRYKSLTASFEFTHREKSYTNPETSNQRTDLAEIRLQSTPWKRAVQANMIYQISNTATAQKERVYIQVSQGDGNYRFDEELNEYVNDPLGDYIMRILTTDQFIPVVELKTSSRIRLTPKLLFRSKSKNTKKKLSLWKRSIQALSSETYIALEENTQEDDVWDIYLLKLSKFRQPNTTIFGNMLFRQDLHIFENNRDFSIRLRHQNRDEKNNQYLEGGQDRIENKNAARITARLSKKFSSQTELTQKRTARIFNISGRQDRDIYATILNTDISFRPKAPLELALEGRSSWEEDRFYETPTEVRAYALIPRVNYSFRGKGRLRTEFEWSHVTATPNDRLIPYEMADGRSIGSSVRWDVRFDYRISQTIQASFSYTGRNEPERDRTIHTARAQVTAAFH